MNAYAEPFHSSLRLEDLSQGVLAVLAREYLLCGHLVDRAGMPYVIAAFDRSEMGEIAIDEWMGASPVYTRRMQKLLGFEGDDVPTIFKGMQFDIGAPHGFLDFRYVIHDAHHGGFELDHCGALMDVEPMGEEFVVTMCHDIEDPTFDATAMATNPRARMRPLHRPPREPSVRRPHCSWTVEIDPEAEPLVEAEITIAVAASDVAATPLPLIPAATRGSVHDASGGDGAGSPVSETELRSDYSGPLVDHIATEDFTSGALVAIIEELCLQQQMLAHAFMLAVQRRHGARLALELGERQFVGSAGMSAHRLAGALRAITASGEQRTINADVDDPGPGKRLALVAEVLALHPMFRARAYVEVEIDLADVGAGNGERGDPRDHVIVRLLDCPGTRSGSPLSWPALLRDGCDRALQAVVGAIDPTLRCVPADAPGRAIRTWMVLAGEEPLPEEPEVTMARFSTGTDFELSRPEATEVTLRSR